MSEDRVVELRHPGSFSEDPLTSVLRSGAQRLLAQAVEMEVTAFIAAHGDLEDDAGRRRVVRHGHHRERRVQTGIGPVAVRCPRVRDRGGAGEAGKIRFTSAILPPYLRRAKSIEELLPWLYLKGISTGDFTEALAALLGPDAPGLSASTITRLKDVWQGELARWEKRDLCDRSRFSKAVISVMATLSWMARWAGRAQRPRSGKRGSAGRGRTRAPGGGVCGGGYRDAAGAGTAIKGEKADRNPRAWVSK